MLNEQAGEFREFLADALSFWGKDVSEFTISVWWEALRPYDIGAVRRAFSIHALNPDSGQFHPKPADIVKALSGTTQDSALVAWSKVDRAVRQIGPYQSVAFDDPIIHRAIEDMGGWQLLCMKGDDDWPFVAKEFENRYRGYRMRGEKPECLPYLCGIIEQHNAMIGKPHPAPVMIEGRKELRQLGVSHE